MFPPVEEKLVLDITLKRFYPHYYQIIHIMGYKGPSSLILSDHTHCIFENVMGFSFWQTATLA